jgi:hypothetical protein
MLGHFSKYTTDGEEPLKIKAIGDAAEATLGAFLLHNEGRPWYQCPFSDLLKAARASLCTSLKVCSETEPEFT